MLSRLAEIAAAATGVAVLALGITYLFSLYGAFQRREELVTTLDARAGAPPSGIQMLETYAEMDLWDDLRRTLRDWEEWSARVLDTHVAYPILIFFRSSHDGESWLGAIGAVLDAAVLLATTVESGPRRTAGAARTGDHDHQGRHAPRRGRGPVLRLREHATADGDPRRVQRRALPAGARRDGDPQSTARRAGPRSPTCARTMHRGSTPWRNTC